MEATRMKVLGVISTAAMFLFLGASVPAFAQEEHQEEGAKPAQHEEEAKPAPKQEQTKPQKQEEQPKTANQEEAKPQKKEKQPNPRSRNSNSRPKLNRTMREISIHKKPRLNRNNHRASSRATARKTAPDTCTTKVTLVQPIMLALRQMAGASPTDAASTPTAAIGSTPDRTQRGFTSRTCTSSWEQMACGTQCHTPIPL